MSDIIQDAKQLQSELQSERADWVRMRGGIDIEMPLDCTVLYGDEEARDVIGALAEEEYEYAVAFKSTNGMGYLDRSGNSQPWPCLAAWYLTKGNAQVALMNSEYRKEALCTCAAAYRHRR